MFSFAHTPSEFLTDHSEITNLQFLPVVTPAKAFTQKWELESKSLLIAAASICIYIIALYLQNLELQRAGEPIASF